MEIENWQRPSFNHSEDSRDCYPERLYTQYEWMEIKSKRAKPVKRRVSRYSPTNNLHGRSPRDNMDKQQRIKRQRSIGNGTGKLVIDDHLETTLSSGEENGMELCESSTQRAQLSENSNKEAFRRVTMGFAGRGWI
eukprot:553426-Amorphochlora_amoeboformis.AAC.1